MTDPKPGALPSVEAIIPASTLKWWPVKWYAAQQTHESPSNIARPMLLEDLCALVSALDDEGKRAVFRALGGMIEVLRFMPEMKDEDLGEKPEPTL